MQNSRGRLQFSNLIGELNVRYWPFADSRFYLPYLCDPILSMEIVSGARPERHPNYRSLDPYFLAVE